MKSVSYLAAALMTAMTLSGGHALANICRTDKLTCSTSMPVDGYCECRSRGTTEGGTVVTTRAPHEHYNATSGGCGVSPGAPGCR
jgi:hypothetical protein